MFAVSLVDASTVACTLDDASYSVGSRDIAKSPCERCRCLPATLYSSASGLVCHVTRCPVPDCDNPSIPDGQCCPRCGDLCASGVEITNCPSEGVRVSLPASRDDVLYRFFPVTRDCSGRARVITTTVTPRDVVYRWNGAAGHNVTVTASVTGASDSCTFTVIPVGKSLRYGRPM